MIEKLMEMIKKRIREEEEMILVYQSETGKYMITEFYQHKKFGEFIDTDCTKKAAIELLKEIRLKRKVGKKAFGERYENWEEENQKAFMFIQENMNLVHDVTLSSLKEQMSRENSRAFTGIQIVENYIEMLETIVEDDRKIVLITLQ